MRHTKKTIIKNGKTYSSNHYKAWRWFEQHGYKNHKGLALHHKDPSLKQRDRARYDKWLIEDLVVMTVAEHRRLHMKDQTKGTKHTKQHNMKISLGRLEHSTRGKLVKIHMDPIAEQTLYFRTLAEAAEYISCSRQLLSQCIRENAKNKKAKGWTVELVGIEGAV